MKRTLIKDSVDNVESTITIKGWVHVRRDHGKLIFLDVRDRTALIQVVVIPSSSKDAHAVASTLRPEDVVVIEGKVNKRPEKLINPKLITGTVELEALTITVLSQAATLPFDM